jgi:DNA-binding PadR family transcriptional regulator
MAGASRSVDTTASKGRRRNRLSELEGAVLGVISLMGPCTAYAVRRVFVRSPSTRWSGSAGAIYPLVRRLEKRGLLSSKPHTMGRRRGRHSELTSEGHKALVTWIGPPFSEEVCGVPPDPIRTRLSFLAVLPDDGRDAFLSRAEKTIRAEVRDAAHGCRRALSDGRTLDHLISRGVLLVARARLRWIREVAESIHKERTRARE